MEPRHKITDAPSRILVVDDELHTRRLLEVMLAPEGFQLLSAASGEEALVIVARDPPDLILLDVMMPGMDGYEVAVRIKGSGGGEQWPGGALMMQARGDFVIAHAC